jgi:hypothetical protein
VCVCVCWGGGEILIVLGGLLFGENIEVFFVEVCMRSIQCEVDFGYKLGICARSVETHCKQYPKLYLTL